MTNYGKIARRHLLALADFSESKQGVTRYPYSRQHRQALNYLEELMRQSGLDVYLDDAGTLTGRLEGVSDKTFYMGSHQDSVRNGGAYDGIMGVVLPILTLHKLQANGKKLPFSVEVLAFADEEGVRFPTALIGSRAMAGTFDPKVLNLKDNQGISIQKAMLDFKLHPDRIPLIARRKDKALGYLEVHIEQGPLLENNDQALGVVSAICGIERHQIQIMGATGHAGTLPMSLRKDALVSASHLVVDINSYASSKPSLRATVGQMNIFPNVVNAVPGRVDFTVEIRSENDDLRRQASDWLKEQCDATATRHGVEITAERTYFQKAVPCDEKMQTYLKAAVQKCGCNGLMLPSGATHDASAMSDLCPISMLFVRCKGGISHSPEEFASAEDMDCAIEAIYNFLKSFEHTAEQ